MHPTHHSPHTGDWDGFYSTVEQVARSSVKTPSGPPPSIRVHDGRNTTQLQPPGGSGLRPGQNHRSASRINNQLWFGTPSYHPQLRSSPHDPATPATATWSTRPPTPPLVSTTGPGDSDDQPTGCRLIIKSLHESSGIPRVAPSTEADLTTSPLAPPEKPLKQRRNGTFNKGEEGLSQAPLLFKPCIK